MVSTWRGKVTDRQIHAWLHQYESRPIPLPADPGPGPFKRSFRLLENEEQLVDRLASHDRSSFLRRLVSLHLGAPQASSRTFRRARLPPSMAGTPPLVEVVGRPKDSRLTLPAAEPKVPSDMPTILWVPCAENAYSPMFRDGRWVRMARTPIEQGAYSELLAHRLARFRRG